MSEATVEFQILEYGEARVFDGESHVFKEAKMIIEIDDSIFMVTTEKNILSIDPSLNFDPSVLDSELDSRVQIPLEDFCPEFRPGFTRVSTPLSEDIYVKGPKLLRWNPERHGELAALLLREAEVCEILKNHPHPNIAQYHGCLVEDGRITGLCFKKYDTGFERMLHLKRHSITEAEIMAISNAIEDGIHHLHGLGLAHNDIHNSNIVMDGEKPVIVNFGCARPIGEELGDRVGRDRWGYEYDFERARFSAPENDFLGLERIQKMRPMQDSPEPL